MDTWLLLRDVKNGAERNRVLHILKSRGMAHSNQIRSFKLTDRGIQLGVMDLSGHGKARETEY
jgi:circadian clock protein KaiC